jgi:hypothetical protein
MLRAEMAPCFAMALLLIPTPMVADVASELARCELEAERLYPAPHNKGAQNWPERAANLQKRAENIETCMRAAGYRITADCSAPLKTYESCMKIADKLMHGPTGSQYRDADWNRTGAIKARKPPSSLRSQTFYAVANFTGSIKVASSASAFELFTRFDTGQRCR